MENRTLLQSTQQVNHLALGGQKDAACALFGHVVEGEAQALAHIGLGAWHGQKLKVSNQGCQNLKS